MGHPQMQKEIDIMDLYMHKNNNCTIETEKLCTMDSLMNNCSSRNLDGS